MAKGKTATGVDIFNTIQKRLNVQGHFPSDGEILTLMIDLCNLVNIDNANALSHVVTELAANPVRPFVRGV